MSMKQMPQATGHVAQRDVNPLMSFGGCTYKVFWEGTGKPWGSIWDPAVGCYEPYKESLWHLQVTFGLLLLDRTGS
jgi:hypothetical protein